MQNIIYSLVLYKKLQLRLTVPQKLFRKLTKSSQKTVSHSYISVLKKSKDSFFKYFTVLKQNILEVKNISPEQVALAQIN